MVFSSLLDVVRWALFGLSHVLGGSLGLGIIGLSVIVRMALLPWGLRAARKSMVVQQSLRALEPRLKALRTRYAKDPAKLHAAMLEEYRTAGINPLGTMSFGLLAVQIPLGWAIYSVVSSGLASGDAFLWIANLANPDATISLIVGALSTLMGATTSATGSPVSPLVMAAVMGVVSGVIVFHMSAGIGLYWASTTVVGILQNALLRRKPSTAGVARP